MTIIEAFYAKVFDWTTLPTPYFLRPGVSITLSTNDNYWKYCESKPKYFHHGIDPYRYFLRQYYKGLPQFIPIAKE